MTELQARKILQLPERHTVAEVRAAFVARCNALHPDSGGTGGDLAQVLEARDLLIGKAKDELPCTQCKGRGYIRARIGVQPCGKCDGKATA